MSSYPLASAVILLLLVSSKAQNSCDFSLQGISMNMQSFNTNGFKPLDIMQVFQRLHSLRSIVLTCYQLCFGKIIPDPSSLYPQDRTECFMGLYNISLFQARYGANYPKIKGDIDAISKVVFSTENDCYPIMNYTGSSTLSDECRATLSPLRETMNSYENEIILEKGKGLQFINNMTLQVEKVRKSCGFDILTKAKRWTADTCQSANIDWLYPIVDKMEGFIGSSNYLNFTAKFYTLYQGIYRVRDMCNVTASLSVE